MRQLRTVLLLGVVALAVVGCSSNKDDGGDSLTNDEAVSALVGQGYTPQAAQCLIDGAAKQNVDVLALLATGELPANGQTVLDAVGTYCVQQFGGTSIPDSTVP